MLARYNSQFPYEPPTLRVIGNGNLVRRWNSLPVLILTICFGVWIGYRVLVQPGWMSHLPQLLMESLGLLETASGVTLAVIWALLWRRRQPVPTHAGPLTIDDYYEMSPSEFEKFVAQLFRSRGYRVKLRGRSGDLGVDLELLKSGGKRAIVQCKRYRNMIGPETVRELYGTLIHERAAHAFLVTTADISQSTRDWSHGKPITLIDGHTFLEIVAALDDQQFE